MSAAGWTLFHRRVIHPKDNKQHYKLSKPLNRRWISSKLATFIFAAAILENIITASSSTTTVKADNGVIPAAGGGLESDDRNSLIRAAAASSSSTTRDRRGAEIAAAEITSMEDYYASSRIQMMRKMLSSGSNDIIAPDADPMEHLLVSKISVDQFDSSFGSDEDPEKDVTGVQTGVTTNLVGAGSSFAQRLHQVRLYIYT